MEIIQSVIDAVGISGALSVCAGTGLIVGFLAVIFFLRPRLRRLLRERVSAEEQWDRERKEYQDRNADLEEQVRVQSALEGLTPFNALSASELTVFFGDGSRIAAFRRCPYRHKDASALVRQSKDMSPEVVQQAAQDL